MHGIATNSNPVEVISAAAQAVQARAVRLWWPALQHWVVACSAAPLHGQLDEVLYGPPLAAGWPPARLLARRSASVREGSIELLHV